MRKIFTIAGREYRAMVATKAFLLSITMMPVLMLGGLFTTQWLNKAGGIKERKIVVWDGTGELFQQLRTSSIAFNAQIEVAMENSNNDGIIEEQTGGLEQFEKYLLERAPVSEITNEYRSEISEKITKGEVYAYLEIPADIIVEELKLNEATSLQNIKDAIPAAIFRSQDSALSQAKQWLQVTLSKLIKDKRLAASGVDRKLVEKAEIPIQVKGMGLFALDKDGNAKEEDEGNVLAALFMPFGVMMLMFMVIFLAAQPCLESVLEEKSQKISEVLLGCANPFQLMVGKLIGVVGGSLTVFSIYILGIIWFARSQQIEIPIQIIPWFVVFQILGVFFYGALFMAVGASVSQLKEAQSMLLPIWMLMMSPMFVWLIIVRDPNGAMATGMSLFPPATPTSLMLRMATGQAIPIWQPIVGLIMMVACTLFVVHIAGRIFRVGILWQGKTPSIREVFKWSLSSN
ncbi:ABC transporter permease [Mariniblastus sp.]|nr:ABC transporter permease [Mariniblastus sp.]MDB4755904.1 ABC transporter permease [Mariniblastus sp.]